MRIQARRRVLSKYWKYILCGADNILRTVTLRAYTQTWILGNSKKIENWKCSEIDLKQHWRNHCWDHFQLGYSKEITIILSNTTMKWATRLCAKASMKWSTGRPLHACRCAAPVDKSNIYLFTSQNALSVHVHVPVHFIILSHLKALNMSHLVSHLRWLTSALARSLQKGCFESVCSP